MYTKMKLRNSMNLLFFFSVFYKAEEEVNDMRDEVDQQKNLIRQQAAEEKRIVEEKLNEMKLDYQDEKARADDFENKV